MANVDFRRREVEDALPTWQMIRDVLEGQAAVKKRSLTYLPLPSFEIAITANDTRYSSYVERAIFYNIVGRTVDGLVGQVFASDPVVDLPDIMQQNLIDDADGTGISMDQLAKDNLRNIIGLGRAGILLDFPVLEEGATHTQQQLQDGEARPLTVTYDPESIRNWRTDTVKGKVVPVLVVLDEMFEGPDPSDPFVLKEMKQRRVLSIVDGAYRVELYKAENGNDFTLNPVDVFDPTDSKGNPIEFIPFIFEGPDNNRAQINKSPIYDMVVINLGHYRNSADFEDSCFMVGQPTPWASGLTQTWVDDNFTDDKGNQVIKLGSRAFLPLPMGAQCGVLQVVGNTMPEAGMTKKETLLVALGAKLVQNQQVQRTLGEAKIDRSTETSVLASAAKNVTTAFTQILRWAGEYFYGLSEAEVAKIWYVLSTDFAISKMTPQEQAQLVANWQGEAITYSEMRDQLRSSGIATLDDKDAKAEIEAERQEALALQPIAEVDANGNPLPQVDANGNPIDPNNPPKPNDFKSQQQGPGGLVSN